MSEDRVVELRHPGSFSEDPLTVVLRSGAQRLLAQAVEMEVTAFIAAHGDLEDDAGRHRVVRHGHHRERQVQTGIGPVAVRCPRVRDRGGAGEAGKIRFTSAILPPYLNRSPPATAVSSPEIFKAARTAWPYSSNSCGRSAFPSFRAATRPGAHATRQFARPAGHSPRPAEWAGQRNVAVVRHLKECCVPDQIA